MVSGSKLEVVISVRCVVTLSGPMVVFASREAMQGLTQSPYGKLRSEPDPYKSGQSQLNLHQQPNDDETESVLQDFPSFNRTEAGVALA